MPKRAFIPVLAVLAASATTVLPRSSFAAPPASSASASSSVLIVDIAAGGDLDAEKIRAAIGKELQVTVVASTDPIVVAPVGRISILVREKTALVSFRKTESDPPVSRTVTLPDEREAAERSVSLLAGNLARDEAGDILNSLGKAPGATPPTSSKADEAKARATELEDLRRLRALIQSENAEDRRVANVGGAVMVGVGVALAVPGLYLRYADGHDNAQSLGTGLLTASVLTTLFGTLSLLSRGSLYDLATSRNDDLASLEGKLRDDAAASRRYRLTSGWLKVGLGAATLVAGVITTFAYGPHASGKYEGVGTLYGAGAAAVGLGVMSLLHESRAESTWRSWQTVRGGGAPSGPTPIVGAGPVQGGAMLQLGLTF